MKDFTTLAILFVGLLFVVELALVARFLRSRGPAPGRRWTLAPVIVAVALALPAAWLARAGALAPGLPGAGMPWEDVTDETPLAESVAAGERAYLNRCAPCHLPEGAGLPPSYPPLIGSAVVAGPVATHVRTALWGSRGIAVPRPGAAQMPGFHGACSDAELAAILTYERNSWGHAAGIVRPSDVAAGRAAGRAEGLDRP